MSTTLTNRINNIKPSATIAVNNKAQELIKNGTKVINLSVGEPDFDTPKFIRDAAIDAINKGLTRYTAADGTIQLKQAICHKLQRDNDLTYATQQVLVTCGAKQALFNAMQAILQQGDEAIILAPYWVSYPDMIILADATPVIIKADIQQQYKITPEQLQKSITSKTKMIILNSPANPSGATYSKQELQAIGKILIQHPNIIILTDDIYEYIVFNNDKFHNILTACPELYNRTIVINGVSKAHAMTGWRIGYAAGPEDIIKGMKKLQSQSTSCANSIAQQAAITAITAPPHDFFPPMLKAYQERHDFLVGAINDIQGLSAIPSAGTFYLFVDATKAISNLQLKDDVELAEHLLEHAHVATVPGTAFGTKGYIRLSFATDMEHLKAAVQSIASVLEP